MVSKKLLLLDLFCGAGGAARGYADAGFEIVGVDNQPQPNYPFEFHQADAMTCPLDGFDVIHASPPCQGYSRVMRHLAAPKPMLIDAVRERVRGKIYVIENVMGAPMPTAIILCGTAFGLRVYRHRLFESNVAMLGPECDHSKPAMNPHAISGREYMRAEWGSGSELIWRQEMGVGWMNHGEGRQAVPPVFTEYIGQRLMEYLKQPGLEINS